MDELQSLAGSQVSVRKGKATFSERHIIKTCFDKPYEVVFLEDGADISLPKTKSVKLDISKFVKKYIPEEYALSPEQQVEFNRRAYMEILEECSNLLQVKQ